MHRSCPRLGLKQTSQQTVNQHCSARSMRVSCAEYSFGRQRNSLSHIDVMVQDNVARDQNHGTSSICSTLLRKLKLVQTIIVSRPYAVPYRPEVDTYCERHNHPGRCELCYKPCSSTSLVTL